VAYLSDFQEDVFISYAHFDDDMFGSEKCGWVTQLHEDLEQRVRTHLGAEVRLWRDCEIRNNDDFTSKILKRLMRTATFLSVLSPSFLQREWCRRELESFAEHAGNGGGVLVDEERSRIFKVEKIPVDRGALPLAMQGTKSYRFYRPDPEQPRRTIELRSKFEGEYFRRYVEALNDLAKDIADLLKSMAGRVTRPPDQPAVYIAETTSDLNDKLSELRRDLKDRGYVVLPGGDLNYHAGKYKTEIRDCLERSAMSVHIVGPEYGIVPEGETKSNVWLQLELALSRRADPNFFRLIWIPPGPSPSDQRQIDFIARINDEICAQPGVDLLNGNIEDLKTIIQDRLAKIRKDKESPAPLPPPPNHRPPSQRRAPDEPFRVYIMCERADQESPSLAALQSYFISQGCEPMLPSFDGSESDVLQVHAENLKLCEGAMIYYGQGSPAWYEAKLRDLRKYLTGRQPPVAAKAIYIAEPASDHKKRVLTLEASILREGSAFAADVVAPFVQKVRSAT
jgi:TIR domain